MSRRDPRIRLRHMLDRAQEAIQMASGRTVEDLRTNRMLLLALTQLVENVGEAASHVPSPMQKAHPEIPWSSAIGTRHRLVHGYDRVDEKILLETVHSDLPDLVGKLQRALAQEPPKDAAV